MTDDLSAKRDAVLQKAKLELAEYFDTVQILCTGMDDEGDNSTWNIGVGSGNMYARVESCREFVLKSDERTRLHVKNEEEK